MNQRPTPNDPLKGTGQPTFDTAMQREMDEMLGHPLFANAPTLSRVLRYLVSETLAGRGQLVKGYAVAVDGLGRSPDFDAQADSYPRVQIGRLRRALETYYAQRAPTAGSCIYLQQGSYLVRFAPIERAYPALASGRSLAVPAELSRDDDPPPAASAPRLPESKPFRHRQRQALAAAATAVLTVAVVAYVARSGTAVASNAQSPLISIEDVANPGKDGGAAPANDAHGMLVDGISKSWLVRVSLDGSRLPDVSQYRLVGRMGAVNQGRSRLYLTLADGSSGALLWSDTIIVSKTSIQDDLGPTIARLSGPYGVIAASESRRRANSFAPGYSCLLQYLGYLQTRSLAVERQVGACLSQASDEERLEPVRLALRATFALEASHDRPSMPAAARAAERDASAAIAVDPKQAYAQFARARIAFFRQDCAGGAKAGRLAAANNPHDPIILSIIGGLMVRCGFADGQPMLERAYRYRSADASAMRL